MKTIAFFNNKGGVGKTSLVYHLAWMFGELGSRVIAVDLDPQANLSGIFLEEYRMEEIWHGATKNTIDGSIAPLFDGTGDIVKDPYIEEVDGRVGLLVGDLELSKREDDLSEQWPRCLLGKERAFRVTTAFARLIKSAGERFEADLALVDVGPNLGAINRAALIASDYVVIPLAPDLFSLQGLRNVGPTLMDWREAWRKCCKEKPKALDINLPSGDMIPLGYIVMRHSVRLDRPVKAFQKWIQKIPGAYRMAVLGEEKSEFPAIDVDPCLIKQLKDYRSLMPLAQEANKPMFMLRSGDGVIGAQLRAVTNCYSDFHSLAKKIIEAIESRQ